MTISAEQTRQAVSKPWQKCLVHEIIKIIQKSNKGRSRACCCRRSVYDPPVIHPTRDYQICKNVPSLLPRSTPEGVSSANLLVAV